jgi:hypothetical protein
LSETNIDWQSEAKGEFYEKFRRVYHHTRISTSSSSIKYNTNYQPGGTLTMITDKYTGCATGTGNDPLGRWSYIEILGQGCTILLVTVYNVCKHSGKQVGSRTAHTQQASLLLREGRTVSPRKAFLDDFEAQVRVWRQAGHELIICGDLNEQLGSDTSGFSRISSLFNLVEIIQHRHGIAGEPPTYARGTQRLDYIFLTPGLESSVKYCGILPYSDLIDSDHCCLYVNFYTKKLLSGDPAILSPTPVRILHSRNAKGSAQYVKAVDAYLTKHWVEQRMLHLDEEKGANTAPLEGIDRDITRGMAHGMNKIRKLYNSPFSPEIKQARLQR